MRPRQQLRFLQDLSRNVKGPRQMRPSSRNRPMTSRGPGMGAGGGPARQMPRRPQGHPSMAQGGPGGMPGGDARKRAFKRRRQTKPMTRGLTR